jgi:hypothetical protein
MKKVEGWGWRLAGEASVITASILLALAMEAWWSGLQDRQAEQDALLSLQQEFVTSLDELHRARGVHQTRCDATSRVRLSLGPSPRAEPADSLAELLRRMSLVSTVNAPVGVLNSLIGGGGLALIEDAELQAALAGWPERMADHRESEDFIFEVVRDQWRPWLFANGLVAPSWARTEAPVDDAFDPAGLTALLGNREFQNMVTAYDSDCRFVLDDSQALERDVQDVLLLISRNLE